MGPGRIGAHGDNAVSAVVLDLSLVLAIAPFQQHVEEKIVRDPQRRTQAVTWHAVSYNYIYKFTNNAVCLSLSTF